MIKVLTCQPADLYTGKTQVIHFQELFFNMDDFGGGLCSFANLENEVLPTPKGRRFCLCGWSACSSLSLQSRNLSG